MNSRQKILPSPPRVGSLWLGDVLGPGQAGVGKEALARPLHVPSAQLRLGEGSGEGVSVDPGRDELPVQFPHPHTVAGGQVRGLRQGWQVLCSSLTPPSKEGVFPPQVDCDVLKGLRWASHLSPRTTQENSFPHKPTRAHPATHTLGQTHAYSPTCTQTHVHGHTLSQPCSEHPP